MFQTIDHKDKRVSGVQTGVELWNPGSGMGLAITGLEFTTSKATAVTLYAGTDAEGNRIIDGDFDENSGVAMTFPHPLQLEVDTTLHISASGTGVVKAVAYGYEARP